MFGRLGGAHSFDGRGTKQPAHQVCVFSVHHIGMTKLIGVASITIVKIDIMHVIERGGMVRIDVPGGDLARPSLLDQVFLNGQKLTVHNFVHFSSDCDRTWS
jgi:hypothetical protein